MIDEVNDKTQQVQEDRVSDQGPEQPGIEIPDAQGCQHEQEGQEVQGEADSVCLNIAVIVIAQQSNEDDG